MRMKQVLWFLMCIGVVAGRGAAAQASPKPDPWAGLRFLVGTWEAKTTGGSAQATGLGSYTFQLELKEHVLARHSAYEACKGPEDFNCRHGDLLYLYPEGPDQALKAIYFDNEGHVIHYSVSTPRPNAVVFLSDAPGPEFRLSYELAGEIMAGKFQVKMPGQAEFGTYLEWSGKRRE